MYTNMYKYKQKKYTYKNMYTNMYKYIQKKYTYGTKLYKERER